MDRLLETSTDDDECVFSKSKHILNKTMVQVFVCLECNERLSTTRNREGKNKFIAFSAISSS